MAHQCVRYPDRMASPVEIEVKIAVASAVRARTILRDAKFSVATRRVFEQNLVLDNARGSLKSNGLLLRVRTSGKGRQVQTALCTFKGPARETPTHHKQRIEREFSAGDRLPRDRHPVDVRDHVHHRASDDQHGWLPEGLGVHGS